MAHGIVVSKKENLLLWITALVYGAFSSIYVLSLKDLIWHPARDEELNATFQAYRETGVLLVKHAGSGSYGAQAAGSEDFVLAGWDDDPGSFVLASLLGSITHSESPYPGLRLFLAGLFFISSFLLPFLFVKIFKSIYAGYAALTLPFLSQILTGSPLLGSQYSKTDAISTLPTYALYGIAGSLVFLGLIGIVWIGASNLQTKPLIFWTIFFIGYAGLCNLFRSNSGIGLCVAIGVLWALRLVGKQRLLVGVLVGTFAIAGALGIQKVMMLPVNIPRATITGQSVTELPDSHNTWHALFLGLSWPQPVSGKDSEFDIIWSDEFGWEQARKIDPEVVVASTAYDEIMKQLYVSEITSRPLSSLELYLEKFVNTILHFAPELILIFISILGIWALRSKYTLRILKKSMYVISPTILWGLVPAVMVMPLLYFLNELEAGIGMLAALSWIGFIAAVTQKVRPEADNLSNP